MNSLQARQDTVAALFEMQAARTPDAVAVVCGKQQLTYSQLNAQANQLAARLRDAGVKPGAVVGVSFERSLNMAVAVLAVLKAGGAYSPLDPAYPPERLRMMVEELEPVVWLAGETILDRLPAHDSNVICPDRDAQPISQFPVENLPQVARAEDLAYLLFTSGSTGRPKAVSMPHGPLVNLLRWQIADSQVGAGAKTLQYAPLSFDVSFQEIFATWCAGGCLLLVDETLRWDFGELLNKIADERVERLFLPVVALVELAAAAVREQCFPNYLKEVITAGEALQITTEIAEFFRKLPGCTLQNQYGPTETHVVSAYRLSGDPDGWPASPPIGRPVSNVSLYVLDRRRNPAPIGIPGELYIGGAALAQGYHRRPELTTERFVRDPFSDKPDARLYRTGDRVRWTAAGQLEFLGRLDEQMKIRGFRVEPAEVESALCEHEAIKDALVVCREDDPGRKQLVAYLLGHRQSAASIGAIRDFIKAKLPEYMVPSAFEILETLPRLPNGKVDRGSLPKPSQIDDRGTPTEPRGPTEEIVAAIWAEVLQLDRVGVHDNFFELGGHSLLATTLIHRLNQAFETSLAVRALFDSPTVALLGEAVDSEQREGHALDKLPLEPASRDAPLPLSFSQERVWRYNDSRYNVCKVFELNGPLNVDALREALGGVMRRHEALRSVFFLQEGEPVQAPTERWDVPFAVVDVSGRENPREAALEFCRKQSKRPFDLAVGPPLWTGVLNLGRRRHLFIIVLHHIVFDGPSMRIFYRELCQLYCEYCRGGPCSLPEVRIQCADFAAYQRQLLSPAGRFYQRQLDYWTSQLHRPSLLKLPFGAPASTVDPADCVMKLGHAKDVLPKLRSISRQENASLFMVLLAAFKANLCRLTNQEDILVGTYIDARTDAELESTFGDFVNLTALRSKLSRGSTFLEVLRRVRRTMLGAYLHREMPFELLVDEFRGAGSEPPTVPVIFDFLHAVETELNLPNIEVSKVRLNDRKEMPWGLTFRITEKQDQLTSKAEFDGNMYKPGDVTRMLQQFDRFLSQVADDPTQTLASLSRLPAHAA